MDTITGLDIIDDLRYEYEIIETHINLVRNGTHVKKLSDNFLIYNFSLIYVEHGFPIGTEYSVAFLSLYGKYCYSVTKFKFHPINKEGIDIELYESSLDYRFQIDSIYTRDDFESYMNGYFHKQLFDKLKINDCMYFYRDKCPAIDRRERVSLYKHHNILQRLKENEE